MIYSNQQKLKLRFQILNSNPDYVANYTEIIRFYTDGSNLPESRLTFKNLLFSISENKVLEELYLNNSFSLSLQGLLIKKEILEKRDLSYLEQKYYLMIGQYIYDYLKNI